MYLCRAYFKTENKLLYATQCLINCSGFLEIKIDADFNALNEYGWN